MKNKGFTLIELLAVVMVLGIIAVIAVPSISSLLSKGKKDALLVTANNLVDATKQYYFNELMMSDEFTVGATLDVSNSSSMSLIDYSGKLPSSGYIIIDSGGSIGLAVVQGKYCAKRETYESEIKVTSDLSDCNIMSLDEIETRNQSCFILNDTMDTITGYKYNEVGCGKNIVIPAEIGGHAITSIADEAFIMPHNYSLALGLIDETLLGELARGETFDLISNIEYSGGIPIIGLFFTEIPPGTHKVCYVSEGNMQLVDPLYELSSSSPYKSCYMQLSSDPEEYMVYGDGITSINFNSAINLTKIGSFAFAYNNLSGTLNLSGATNLKEIGAGAFSANQIQSITLPSGLNNIDGAAFYRNAISGTLDLSNLDNVNVISPLTFSDNQIEALVLSNKISEISFGAFGHNNIQTFTIPDSVTTIKQYAFQSNSFTTITIPANVITIETEAFDNNLFTSVTVNGSTNHNKYRFNNVWTDIGFPSSLMVEDPGGDYNYTLITNSANSFSYAKGSYLLTVPTTGVYKVQLWGGAGGGANSGIGGYGGYISANLSLTAGTTYKLVMGQGGIYVNGVQSSLFPSQGGGGAGYGYGGSGGGATILSINGTETILAVAGGGGGASESTYIYDDEVGSGGYIYSSLNSLNGTNSTYRSGGTQTTGGQNLGSGSSYGNDGSYLQGGSGFGNASTCVTTTFSSCDSGGGGGGGYYGGSGGGADNDAGSGGSSYVNTTYGSLNMEKVPSTFYLRKSLNTDENGESGYAMLTFIG